MANTTLHLQTILTTQYAFPTPFVFGGSMFRETKRHITIENAKLAQTVHFPREVKTPFGVPRKLPGGIVGRQLEFTSETMNAI